MKLILLSLLLSFNGYAVADKLSEQQVFDVLYGASNKNVSQSSILKVFNGPPGLTGVLVATKISPKGDVAWITTDNHYVITGSVLTVTGENITTEAEAILNPKMHHNVVTLLNQKGKAIKVGSKGIEIDVIYKLSCLDCFNLWKRLQPAIDAGKLQVNYFIVTEVGQKNDFNKAIQLLKSANASSLFTSSEAATKLKAKNFNRSSNAIDNATKKILSNNAIYAKYLPKNAAPIIFVGNNVLNGKAIKYETIARLYQRK